MSKPKKTFGLMAEYATPRDIFHACEKVRDAGYVRWDSHTPFPVHNLDKAMGLRPSPLPWIVFACGMTGASCGFLLQWWERLSETQQTREQLLVAAAAQPTNHLTGITITCGRTAKASWFW